ncbi:hypothetical protein BSKO_06215 [Bryopsis sp. KO-2023]|nr:hypothetical protein BSKO_06215 [Bryopsis sp. KO-2023]
MSELQIRERLRKAHNALATLMGDLAFDEKEQDEEALLAAKEEQARRQKQLEEQAKADAFREKIERKANTIAVCIRRFLAACEAMEAERRQQRRQAQSQGQQKKSKKAKSGKKKGKSSPLMLWAMVVTTPAKTFPKKQMNEVMCTIKNSFFQSVTARDYRAPKIPDACRRGAQNTFRDNGLPAVASFESGFTVEEMFGAGYTIKELKECGARISSKLKDAQIT